jgi:hypothetical protein
MASSTFKCELESLEQVMDYYRIEAERNNSPLYQIFVGVTTDPMAQVTIWEDETNPDGAEEHLRNLLEMFRQNPNNTNVYTIRCVKSFNTAVKKGQEVKTGTGNGLRFQLNKPLMSSQPNQINGQPIINLHGNGQQLPAGHNNELIQVLKDRIKQLEVENEELRNKQAIAALPEIEDEEGDEEEESEPQMNPKDMLFAALGGILMNPQIQEKIALSAIGFLDKIASPTQNTQQNDNLNTQQPRPRFKPNANSIPRRSINETIEQG